MTQCVLINDHVQVNIAAIALSMSQLNFAGDVPLHAAVNVLVTALANASVNLRLMSQSMPR